jgi:predicted dehydrogenase
LRIGILGAAGIAPAAVICPARRRDDVEILAVASRRRGSAREYAKLHSISRAYDSYGELLADIDVDLVYIALPPSEHAEWSIRALEHGKDVLCEKPFAMNTADAQRMRDAADRTGSRLIEAFHDRYHPLSLELDEITGSGRLGEIVSLRAEFSASNAFDPVSIRHDPAAGGGALMDLGCYPVHWVRALLREEPTVTRATATLNPLGADMSMVAELKFPSGATADVICRMDEGPVVQTLEVEGTLGSLRVSGLVFPSYGHSIEETVGGVTTRSTVRGLETYDHQLDAVVRGLRSGESLLTEGSDSIQNMAAIDAIYQAAGIAR